MMKKKLETIVTTTLFGGLTATLIASGINEESAKSGIEAAKTYFVAVPIGVTIGYLLGRFFNYLERKGYDFSGGCPKP